VSTDEVIAGRPGGQALEDDTAFQAIAVWLAEVSAEAAREALTLADDRNASGANAPRGGGPLPPSPKALS
jgi:hypothetical protein